MSARPITRRQLVRLHTLWGLLARREGFDAKDRDARIAWFNRNVLTLDKATDGIEWELHSFKELSVDCAARAIEKIQVLLPPELLTRRGGRRRRRSKKPGAIAIDRARHAPTGAQLSLIETRLAELGHDREWLDQWLATGHTAPCRAIRTRRDAERVLNALGGMLRHAKKPAPEAAEVTV